MTDLDLILDSVRDTLGTDDLDSHPLVNMASAHGIGFLTGAASICARQAGEAEQHGADGQDFESLCLEAITFLMMAIHVRRLRDATELASYGVQPNLSGAAEPDFGELRPGDTIGTGIPGVTIRVL